MTPVAILARGDEALGTHEPSWGTLAPDRSRARSLSAIAALVLPPDAEPAVACAWAQGLVTIATAMHDSFPENLLWDLDYLGASLWHEGTSAAIEKHAAAIADVQRVFGRRTPIAFRYVHDFSYGFDWAKWVARDPDRRTHVRPFSPAFVAAMAQRGQELLAAVAAGDDPRYPPLPDDRPRNPFGFSREPDDELALMRHLANHDQLPVAAWRVDAKPRWDRQYARLRHEAAAALGLVRQSS